MLENGAYRALRATSVAGVDIHDDDNDDVATASIARMKMYDRYKPEFITNILRTIAIYIYTFSVNKSIDKPKPTCMHWTNYGG